MKAQLIRIPATVLFVAAAILVSSCNSTSRNAPPQVIGASFLPTAAEERTTVDPLLLQRPSFEYRLGPGDMLDIEVLGEPTTQVSTVVGPDGKVYFYLLPGIDVWGMTLTQARERIVTDMQKYVREQQPVSLSLRRSENQRIWLLGRLGRPGIYSMTGPMTLLDALSEAGGTASATGPDSSDGLMSASGMGASTGKSASWVRRKYTNNGQASSAGLMGVDSSRNEDSADLGRAFVIRQGRMLRVDFARLLREGDMTQNIYLQPDDFIYVPSATVGNVHVLGAVNLPRSLDYANQLTLVQAISQSGGTVRREAHLSHVAIVRGALVQPQIAVVDLNAILSGKAPDIALEAQDIVFVPYTQYRVLNRYVDLILDTFVRTVGVNEGARAAGGTAQVGVSVPVGSPL